MTPFVLLLCFAFVATTSDASPQQNLPSDDPNYFQKPQNIRIFSSNKTEQFVIKTKVTVVRKCMNIAEKLLKQMEAASKNVTESIKELDQIVKKKTEHNFHTNELNKCLNDTMKLVRRNKNKLQNGVRKCNRAQRRKGISSVQKFRNDYCKKDETKFDELLASGCEGEQCNEVRAHLLNIALASQKSIKRYKKKEYKKILMDLNLCLNQRSILKFKRKIRDILHKNRHCVNSGLLANEKNDVDQDKYTMTQAPIKANRNRAFRNNVDRNRASQNKLNWNKALSPSITLLVNSPTLPPHVMEQRRKMLDSLLNNK